MLCSIHSHRHIGCTPWFADHVGTHTHRTHMNIICIHTSNCTISSVFLVVLISSISFRLPSDYVVHQITGRQTPSSTWVRPLAVYRPHTPSLSFSASVSLPLHCMSFHCEIKYICRACPIAFSYLDPVGEGACSPKPIQLRWVWLSRSRTKRHQHVDGDLSQQSVQQANTIAARSCLLILVALALDCVHWS